MNLKEFENKFEQLKCKACDGVGLYALEENLWTVCEDCKGNGMVWQVRQYKKCPDCQDSGTVFGQNILTGRKELVKCDCGRPVKI